VFFRPRGQQQHWTVVLLQSPPRWHGSPRLLCCVQLHNQRQCCLIKRVACCEDTQDKARGQGGQASFRRLVVWLHDNGGRAESLALGSSGKVRELVAISRIKQGEMPVFIPTCCQIEFGYGEGDNTPASLKDIVSRVPPQMWALQLALVLSRVSARFHRRLLAFQALSRHAATLIWRFANAAQRQ